MEWASMLGSLAFSSIRFGFKENWSIQKSAGPWQAAVVGWAWAEEQALSLSALLVGLGTGDPSVVVVLQNQMWELDWQEPDTSPPINFK